jgi:hypothetical protein
MTGMESDSPWVLRSQRGLLYHCWNDDRNGVRLESLGTAVPKGPTVPCPDDRSVWSTVGMMTGVGSDSPWVLQSQRGLLYHALMTDVYGALLE